MESLISENQKLPGNIPRAIHERFIREDNQSNCTGLPNETDVQVKSRLLQEIAYWQRRIQRQHRLHYQRDQNYIHFQEDYQIEEIQSDREGTPINEDLTNDDTNHVEILEVVLNDQESTSGEEISTSVLEPTETEQENFDKAFERKFLLELEMHEDLGTLAPDSGSSLDGSESDTSGIFSIDTSDSEIPKKR